MLSLAGSFFSSVLLDTPFHIRTELPFLARWIVWIPLTPIAISFAERRMYASSKPPVFAAYQLSVYLLVCTIHIFLASLVATYIAYSVHLPHNYATILKKCAMTGVFYNFIIYGTILLLLNSFRYYQSLQNEKLKTAHLETSLVSSRLQFLRQQLEPHFLFNTHHSIITLMKMGQKEKSVEMMEKLSELMRIALRENEDHEVSLGKEIETLQLYLDIQKIRFGDKLDARLDIAPNTMNVLVPGMILQPLVENSVKYAVERSTEKGIIFIKASKENGQLVLTVKDQTNSKTAPVVIKGTGLLNTEERLHQLYNSAAGFLLQPYSEGNTSGLSVTISIPCPNA